MQLSPYLYFSGNCEEAIAFYQQATGAKLTVKMTWGDVPAEKNSSRRNRTAQPRNSQRMIKSCTRCCISAKVSCK